MCFLDTGIGKFTWLLVFVCGWANASDSVEILSVSFLLPEARKDLDLSLTDQGVLNSIIFVGKSLHYTINKILGEGTHSSCTHSDIQVQLKPNLIYA